MSTDLAPAHIYHREINHGIRTSLSVISDLIGRDARVLDLGTGSGALGKHLSQTQGCQVDGLTYNAQEAEIARPYYRRIEVADLERCSLPDIFEHAYYDYIVCADVLEHVRNPERIAESCKDLLAPGGQLIVSVPNLSYCGLVAELMGGEFLYRDEGLLDRTHVRFFTRNSLEQFFLDTGWNQGQTEVITRALNESEFNAQFDALPPTVARHLLSLPDALAYQFVVSATPTKQEGGRRTSLGTGSRTSSSAEAVFSSQLYLGNEDGFSESRKLVGQGVIGKERQTLEFSIPVAWQNFTRIRFDPADRAGYFYLYYLTLKIGEAVAWEWRLDQQGAAEIGKVAHQQIIFNPPLAGSQGCLLFLTGADPWLALPVPDNVRQQIAPGSHVRFEVSMGWPMSADYLVLAASINATREKLQAQTIRLESVSRTLAQERINYEQSVQALNSRENQLLQALGLLREEFANALAFEGKQVKTALNEQSTLKAKLDALEHANAELTASTAKAQTLSRALLAEKKTLGDERDDLAARLLWIENSRLFRLSRPLVRAKMRINPLLRYLQVHARSSAQIKQGTLPTKPAFQVDIVVPVYKGLEDTQRCILSVLRSSNQTPMRVIAINDASPEPEVTAWLREISAIDSRVLLLENETNLGFVATVNRGMSVSDSHDVILLNSDTEVANDWLDRLKNAAYISDKVGTVTPFSNNATICSYPAFCEENPMVSGHTTASLDALFASSNGGEVVDIPTGVGFCMYIRRECLSLVGLFDVANFGKGYGEENDFCRRVAKAGWRNLHALDTFVLHAGGVSFGASKNERVLAALQTLARLYPDYDSLVQDFIKRDPAWKARVRIDCQRIQMSSAQAKVLFVLHDRSGGTVRHAAELAEHLNEKAMVFSLAPLAGKKLSLRLLRQHEGFRLDFALPHHWDDLIAVLKRLGIESIHYHHLIGHDEQVSLLPQLLGIPYDFTAHDYYTYCPQISLTGRNNKYCGELGLSQCQRCLQDSPAPGGVSIEMWHSRHKPFLLNARRIFAPSQDCRERIAHFSGRTDIIYSPHTDIPVGMRMMLPKPRKVLPGQALKIAVIGALSPIKGADVLEDVAREALHRGLDLDFHLIGYAYRQLNGRPEIPLTVHGAYEERDLPTLLEELEPHLVWFPALWPETYSYTLSAALLQGLPIVGPDLGAFAERLRGREWSWTAHWDQTPSEWVTMFQSIRSEHFDTGIAPPVVGHSTFPAQQTWNYLDGYIDSEIKIKVAGPLDVEHLCMYCPSKAHPDGALTINAKAMTLRLVAKIRSTQIMSKFVRHIPLRWQSRLKSWLLT